MKKLYPIFLVVLIVMLAVNFTVGQEVVSTNSVPIAWDEVPKVEPTDILTYELFRTPYPITSDRQDASLYESLGEFTGPPVTVTFTVEGIYVIGVRTVRDVEGTGEFTYSEINWSDENGANTPNPFLVRYFVAPESPENLRFQ